MELREFVEVSEILRSGIYALVGKGEVLYVGKSKCMLGRIYSHRQVWTARRRGRKVPDWVPVKGIMFDTIWVRPAPLADLDALERDMINLYKPRYNESLKTSDKVTQPVALTINGTTIVLNRPPAPPSLMIERRA